MPKCPYRPDRPMRCKYVSECFGKSKLMTTFTAWMSMPRVNKSNTQQWQQYTSWTVKQHFTLSTHYWETIFTATATGTLCQQQNWVNCVTSGINTAYSGSESVTDDTGTDVRLIAARTDVKSEYRPEQTRLRPSPCRKSWNTRLRCCWFILAWM